MDNEIDDAPRAGLNGHLDVDPIPGARRDDLWRRPARQVAQAREREKDLRPRADDVGICDVQPVARWVERGNGE